MLQYKGIAWGAKGTATVQYAAAVPDVGRRGVGEREGRRGTGEREGAGGRGRQHPAVQMYRQGGGGAASCHWCTVPHTPPIHFTDVLAM